MSPHRRAALLLALLTVAAGACQKNDQASVQPEKLASSTPAGSGSAPAAAGADATGAAGDTAPQQAQEEAQGQAPAQPSGGPLLPYASGKRPPPPPKGATAPTGKSGGVASPSPPPAGAKADVQLLEPGAEPRRELRLRSKAGHAEKMKMTMKMDIGMTLGGQKAPSNALPPMVMLMDMKVTDTKPNGDIHYEFVMSGTDVLASPGVKPEIVSLMKAALGKMKGLRGEATVTNRGFNRDAKIDVPAGVDQQTKQVMQGMEQALQQIGAPLPNEPVGLGARWRYATPMTQNGITMNQQATYHLVKVDGDQLTCDVDVVQSAARQKVASPVGVTVDLLSLSSKGGGKTVFRLDRLAPMKSGMDLTSDVGMGLPDGKKMQMSTRMSIQIGPG